MTETTPTIPQILQDVTANLREVIRSEGRLLAAELKQKGIQLALAGVSLVTGAVLALLAAVFLLICAMYLLEFIMPPWLAALVIAVLTGIYAATLLISGVKKLRHIGAPAQTLETLREDVQWVKHLKS